MSSENIIVCCRCRPFNEKEKAAGHSKISEIDTKAGSIKLKSPKAENDVKTFTFDALFDETSAQVISCLFATIWSILTRFLCCAWMNRWRCITPLLESLWTQY